MRTPTIIAGTASAVLVLGTAAAVIGGAAASAAPSAARAVREAATQSTIKNVDNGTTGYGVLPKAGGATAFRYAQAMFTVPTISTDSCSPGGNVGLVAALGSFGSGDGVEQAGVYENCDGGPLVYQGGYIPADRNNYGNPPDGAFSVSPGDTIFASVSYNGSTKQYTYTVRDLTINHTMRVTQACPSGATCTNNSAEVMADTPAEQYVIFGAASFSDIKLTDSAGHQGGLTDPAWTLARGGDPAPDQSPPYSVSPPFTNTSTSPYTAGGPSAYAVYDLPPG